VGLIAAIPPVCSLLIMPFWARSSDRHHERHWHLIGAMTLSAIGWLLVILAPEPELRLLGLCCTTVGAFCSQAVFFTLPQAILSDKARPAGIGVITTIGLLGSAVSPFVIGYLKDLSGSFSAGLYYVFSLLLIACIMTLCVSGSRRRTVAASAEQKS
jgi:ACS family 4-hydroxyphenylacetate permease-like MFS transporter